MHGYLDNELEPAEAAAVAEHLAVCSDCRHACHRQRALGSAVRAYAADRFSVPAGLRARILAALPGAEPAPSFRLFSGTWLKPGVALAGVAALTWSLTYFLVVPGPDERLADEAISGHLRSLLVNHLTDIDSSDPITVRAWFSARLNFVPPIRDLSGQGFALAGGRLDYLYDQEVAAVIYRRGPAVINLFIWPAETGRDSALRSLSDEGFSILLWTKESIHFCLISRLGEQALTELASAYGARED